jgi:hypothetical protein
VTSLRQRVLDELQRRNYSPATTRGYILAIKPGERSKATPRQGTRVGRVPSPPTHQ